MRSTTPLWFLRERLIPEFKDRLSQNPQTRLRRMRREGFVFYYLRDFPPADESIRDQEWYAYLNEINGRIALDIGAHAGDYSLRFSKRFEKVIAFEPDPTNRYVLLQNIKRNNVRNISVDSRAVSRTSGTAVLRRSTKVRSGSTLEPSHYDWVSFDGYCQVETVSLDNWQRENPESHVDFVKIDAENHEGSVLEGAARLVLSQKPLVGLEVHQPTDRFEVTGKCLCNACQVLASYGYTLDTRKPTHDADAHWSFGRPRLK